MLSFLSVRRKGRGTPKSISKITKLFVPNKNLLQCKVVFLDGTDISLDLSKKAVGGDLYKWVFYSLDLIEKDYFGLQYTDADNVEHWLDPAKAVKKQVKVGPPYTFFLKVKFYSSEPSLLQEELTRYQFFLQLKHDIAEGKLLCPPEKAVELSALALQSELGDYDEKRHTPALISEFRFIPDQTEEFEFAVLDAYQSCRGLTPAQAEINFLSKVIWLPNYAVKHYVVMGNDSNEYYLGLMPTGVKLVEGSEQIGLFRWPNILRLDFKKEKITLVAVDDNGHEEHTFVFRLHDKKTCRRLWKSAVEYHTFFRLHAPGKAPTVRPNLFRVGSRFWSRGKTEADHTRSHHRRSTQFERRPSQRYACRQSHILRLAQEENADTLPSKMNLSRCRGDDDPVRKAASFESQTVNESNLMTTIEETTDAEPTMSSDVETTDKDVLKAEITANEGVSALKEASAPEELSATEDCSATEEEVTATEESSATVKQTTTTKIDIETTVATSTGRRSFTLSLHFKSPTAVCIPSPSVVASSTSQALELQRIGMRDCQPSTPLTTPTSASLSRNKGFPSATELEVERENPPHISTPPCTPTFAPLSINESFQSASKTLEFQRMKACETSTSASTPIYPRFTADHSFNSPSKSELREVPEISTAFLVNSSFRSASKSELQRDETPQLPTAPCTPTLAPCAIDESFQIASKALELQRIKSPEASNHLSSPTYPPFPGDNSFNIRSLLELQIDTAPEISTPPSTPTFAPLLTNNSFDSASISSDLPPMQRLQDSKGLISLSTPILPTPEMKTPTAKLVTTAE